jgi:hypothetical protein
MGNQNVPAEDNEVTTVAPWNPADVAKKRASRQNPHDQRPDANQPQNSGAEQQGARDGTTESLPIDDEDLNEQGDDRLSGDERGGG